MKVERQVGSFCSGQRKLLLAVDLLSVVECDRPQTVASKASWTIGGRTGGVTHLVKNMQLVKGTFVFQAGRGPVIWGC